MNWIIPANMKTYNVLLAFAENIYVDWRQSAKFNIGDTVYIYVSRPYQRVMFKTEVVCINLVFDETIEDKKYWTNQEEYENGNGGEYMRLRLIEKSDNQLLALSCLMQVGMKGAPQSATKNLPADVFKYIEEIMQSSTNEQNLMELDKLNRDFMNEVKKSKELSNAQRADRLAKANKHPEVVRVVSSTFKRNADVVAAVLEKAHGVCENCGADAPFKRASDGTPYLEVHHKKRLADGGEDTVENTIAVCPNCHRELHYGL